MSEHSIDLSNHEEYQPGKWRVAIPEPFYLGWFWGLFSGKRLVCECGQRFKAKSDYKYHYRSEIEKVQIEARL